MQDNLEEWGLSHETLSDPQMTTEDQSYLSAPWAFKGRVVNKNGYYYHLPLHLQSHDKPPPPTSRQHHLTVKQPSASHRKTRSCSDVTVTDNIILVCDEDERKETQC